MQFITKKVIKGKAYYYLQYAGYNMYLGDNIPSNIKKAMISFFTRIGEEEAKKLNKKIIESFAPKHLKEIEIMKYIFILISKSDLFKEEFMNYLNKLIINFTFNSNRSEGSRVTKKEVEEISTSKIRKPKTKTEREVLNSVNAFMYIFSNDMKWNMLGIKKLHALLLNGLDDELIIGKWKSENVVAPGNQPTTPPDKVQEEMKQLFSWLESRCKNKMYPPLLATEFYTRFESIHPFLDGNGRVGRLLLNAILVRFNYMPIVFFTENHEAHCHAITKALQGQPKKFRHHFIDQAKKTFDLIKVI